MTQVYSELFYGSDLRTETIQYLWLVLRVLLPKERVHEVVLDVEVEQVQEQGSTRHGWQLVPLHVQLTQVSEEEKYMGLINTASPKINVHNKEISITLTLNDKLFYC